MLTFGDSGYTLYTAMRVPASLNWTCVILEFDEDVVELSQRIDTVVDCKNFDTFATSAMTRATAQTSIQVSSTRIFLRLLNPDRFHREERGVQKNQKIM